MTAEPSFAKTTRGRVALYLPHLRVGGAEMVFVRLGRGLAAAGYDVHYVLDRREGDLVAATDLPVHDLGAKRTIAAVPSLARWLTAHRPSVLLSAIGHNNIVALLARRLARSPCAVVVAEHSILSHQVREEVSWQFRLMPFLARRFYPSADAVLAVSESGGRDLERILRGRIPVEVVGNPVVDDDLSERVAAAVAHPWLQGDGPPVLIAAGRLTAVKDFATLLTAFAEVARQSPARLIILGEGPERGALEALRQSLGLADRVDLPGVVRDPLPWFARAAGVVMSSSYEGFGLVLVEAMACGTPVATAEAGGPPAEIVEGGRLGPVVPSRDPPALAAAMLEVLRNPVAADRLRRRAADFSLASSVRRYAEIIERVRLPVA